MKTCTRCRQVKPLTEFHVMRARADGRKPACKAVVSQFASDAISVRLQTRSETPAAIAGVTRSDL